ncbi:sulfotransferase 1A1-like [Gigantopelta aegis]|uniref:sulfotransferase 1A1-like n=1 Tax=Gigantopelta aegis TaxID=1735272 RepID=UPI001B88D2E2|nr:sulfotransferase 1A1-like [Gigantopelta aegis]
MDYKGDDYPMAVSFVEGIPFPFEYQPISERIRELKSMEMRPDDVILCSYMKSGTHWVFEILNMLIKGKAEYTEHWKNSSMLERVPVEEFKDRPSPRILQTHSTFRFLPKQVVDKKCRIIYVERNPKSVCVSLFNHLRDRKQLREGVDWPQFLTMFLNGTVPYGSWFEVCHDWRRVRAQFPDVPVLFLHYEALKADPVAEAKKTATFLGLDLADGVLEEIVEACSFHNLKNAHMKKDSKYATVEDGAKKYFRKGTTDEWKSWFTVAQSETFDQMCDDKDVSQFIRTMADLHINN